MKYLLLVAIVVVLIWHWRATRRAEIAQKKYTQHTKTTSVPLNMVQCDHCQVHLAQSEAVAGRHGHYCSADHLTVAEA